MTPVFISYELKAKVPDLRLSCIESEVSIQDGNENLWNIINEKTEEVASSIRMEQISQLPAIAASRLGYKICGKDPARYRLSAEALLRRTVQGKRLYRVNNVVDLLNLVSISTGFSIGGYDAEKIKGPVEFGIGRKNEPYEGIGRGELNIEFLPVFRDKCGAFGTPTSDSERTAVTQATKRFLMIIIDFGTPQLLDKADILAENLLQKFAEARNLNIWRI